MPATATITPRHIEQFREEGFCVLENVIPSHHLEDLRSECSRLIAETDASLDAEGTAVRGITHKGKRYFISNQHPTSRLLRRFLFSDLMAEICQATLGPDAYLFNEQYVVKNAEVGMKFAWHQDSGYIGYPHRPYLSCWCALDDVNEANGTVYMLPYAKAGTREWTPHVREDGSNDLVGYHGDDPGVPVIAPAGTIAVFSSTCFHRSGANTTNRTRRIYLAQYSAEPLLSRDGSKLWGHARPLLQGGVKVNDGEALPEQALPG